MVLVLIAALTVIPHDDPDLVRGAIDYARTVTLVELVSLYTFESAIYVETPFLRVAFLAREAFDRHLPFSESDINRTTFSPDITISARDEKRSFKHLVIAVRPAAPPEMPAPSTRPPIYEEVVRQQKEARKKSKGDRRVEAAIAEVKARQAITRREREERAAMTVVQPKAIEATEHVWQNAFSATFKTVGVKATFPADLLAPGNQVWAILADGSELIVDLTPEIVAKLR